MLFRSVEKEAKDLELIQGRQEELYSYVISPIIANGDPIGSVVMLSEENNRITEVEQKAVETAASFLAKQME